VNNSDEGLCFKHIGLVPVEMCGSPRKLRREVAVPAGFGRGAGPTARPQLLLEDIIQPVKFDLVFEARVVHLAVGLAAIDQANQAFRLRAGSLAMSTALLELSSGDIVS
jgi:hypothetical protein